MSAMMRAMAMPPWVELRIDVDLPQPVADLETVAAHWQGRGREQADSVALPGLSPSLEARLRQADGEYFVYVAERVGGRLVAYITLNRLIEVNRRADLHLRSPHTRILPAYRRRGIASAVYRWWLDSGRSLMTGARQSPGARALWLSLAASYPLIHVRLESKRVCLLPPGELSTEALEPLNVRAVLLGAGGRTGQFADGLAS